MPTAESLDNDRALFKFKIGILCSFIIYSMLLIFSSTVAKADSLMDLFTTDAFTGSWEVFSHFQIIGFLMNFAISAFSLIGLFLIVYQRFITLLYLSSRTTFDKIHEIKQSGNGTRFLGFEGIGKNIFKASNGTGLDAIVSFVLSLLPDVKEYSDYRDGDRPYNLKDSDTAMQYIMKVSLPTVMLLFLFTIGFSGTLFRIYGNVVEAMATAGDTFVNTKLSTYVDKLINKGSAYKFAYEDDGTEIGKLRQRIAESIYTSVIKYIDNPNSDAMLQIGKKVDDTVAAQFTADGIAKVLGNQGDKAAWSGDDSGAKNIQFTTVVNASTSAYSAGDIAIPLSSLSCNFEIGGAMANISTPTVHVVFSKKSNSVEKDYFATGSNKNNNNGDKNYNQNPTQIQ